MGVGVDLEGFVSVSPLVSLLLYKEPEGKVLLDGLRNVPFSRILMSLMAIGIHNLKRVPFLFVWLDIALRKCNP